MASYLITGGARGFGLALAKELASRPASEVSKVIVSARTPSPDLDSIVKASSGRVQVVEFDVTDEASIKGVLPDIRAMLGGSGLDVLINNAGIAQYAPDGTKSMDNLEESIRVNVLGVHYVTRNLLPLLEEGKLRKVVNVASPLGSIGLASAYTYMPAPAYKISKAALHALTVQYSLDYAESGFSFIALCPGWMKTALGGGDIADLSPEQAARASLEIIGRQNAETNGRLIKTFVDGFQDASGPNRYDGKEAPW